MDVLSLEKQHEVGRAISMLGQTPSGACHVNVGACHVNVGADTTTTD